ncbi:uncharacterized protein CC84DRAFT_701654 [Paraphaeosphaeria sporulosa]|uniref:Uncharacterized protein n=1 Tax=Paraphaeosphaeria sporulosa TaxID=1460663 RepID=A0A177CL63_9PLEO|nr:uncharacterized protein CC84DRAFT_701654 [Paraphaeosphaeria sporulosa]OAG07608.1 hypothetical protein CC84DRAFT_701654 [Paraphaeosphaeria sporulosa]
MAVRNCPNRKFAWCIPVMPCWTDQPIVPRSVILLSWLVNAASSERSSLSSAIEQTLRRQLKGGCHSIPKRHCSTAGPAARASVQTVTTEMRGLARKWTRHAGRGTEAVGQRRYLVPS